MTIPNKNRASITKRQPAARVITPDSLKEALIRSKRKESLTKLYDDGDLPFHEYSDDYTMCSDCCAIGAIVRKPGKRVRTPIALLQMDDEDGMLLCHKCFCIRFYNKTAPGKWWTPGLHPDTPLSESNYNGSEIL